MTTEDIDNYKQTVDNASDRLLNLCNRWTREISENEKNMSEEIVQKIHSVIGKSHLLRNSKFKQFRGFLHDAEGNIIGKPVQLDDIRGFWETICIQVEQVEKTFNELEVLKQNDYVQSSTVSVPDGPACPPRKPQVKKAPAPSKKPAVAASSNLKNFISAQRERKKVDAMADEVHIATGKLSSNGHA